MSSSAREQARRAHRLQRRAEQPLRAHARPVAEPVADPAVHPLARELDVARGGAEADLELRVQRLEAAEPARQPLGGDRGRGADGERAAEALLTHPLHAGDQLVERAAHRGQQKLPLVGQEQPTIEPAEQLGAQVLLERLDLVADRGLGHEQLLGRLGEAQQARRGLEGAQRVQWRQAGRHRLSNRIRPAYVKYEKASFVGNPEKAEI
jgi:hypothetical protein